MRYLIMSMLVLLTGCSFLGDIRHTNQYNIDPNLLQSCKVIPVNITEDTDIGTEYIKLLGDYGTCANMQESSILTIKKLGNIK